VIEIQNGGSPEQHEVHRAGAYVISSRPTRIPETRLGVTLCHGPVDSTDMIFY